MLTQEYLKTILYYHSVSGDWVWLISPKYDILAGTQAGTIVDLNYMHITINCKVYKAHILAWFYTTGEWPIDEIDHKDNIGYHNEWSNLRECSGQQNNYNKKKYKNNSSGYKGVTWSELHQKWRARIQVDRKNIHLGLFNTREEAALAYNQAAIKYFGEFAKLNKIIA